MNTIKGVFRSGKFIVGFVIFILILGTCIIYPLIVTSDPLAMLGQGNFFPPGTYISQEEAALEDPYTLQLPVEINKLDSALDVGTRADIQSFLIKQAGVAESEIDVTDADSLAKLWKDSYDPEVKYQGLTSAKRKKLKRIDAAIDNAMR